MKNPLSSQPFFIPALSVVAVGALALAACNGSDDGADDVTSGTVIQNVTVVNTQDGSLASGMSVVLSGGKIQKVAATASVHVNGDAQTVDGTGKYLVPGFLDMHTHSMDVVDEPTTFWPLLIANGITGVREMAGSPELIQRAKKLNADSASGTLDAPEVLMIPGNILNGVASAASGVQLVQQQKAAGASFIKLVNASHDATLAVLGEARTQGLTVAGHLPTTVNSLEVSNAGWRAMEHLGSATGVLLDCAADEASIRQSLLNGEGAKPPFPPTFVMTPMLYRTLDAPFYQRAIDTYDAGKCQALAQAFKQNETWQVPTLIRLRTAEFSDDTPYRTDPNLVYVDKTRRALWESLAQQYTATVPATAAATFRRFYGQQQKLTLMLKRSGVKMLAGSDLGGIWVIPGFSLHQEFRELAAAGLSPLEVLQMTTWNGAEFLHRQADMGTVEAGKNADLVLLDANPVSDVANLDKIAAVFLKGKHFPKEALAQLKADVADAYEKQPLKAAASALSPSHVD